VPEGHWTLGLGTGNLFQTRPTMAHVLSKSTLVTELSLRDPPSEFDDMSSFSFWAICRPEPIGREHVLDLPQKNDGCGMNFRTANPSMVSIYPIHSPSAASGTARAFSPSGNGLAQRHKIASGGDDENSSATLARRPVPLGFSVHLASAIITCPAR